VGAGLPAATSAVPVGTAPSGPPPHDLAPRRAAGVPLVDDQRFHAELRRLDRRRRALGLEDGGEREDGTG
jgi:hypothetical protein